MIEIQNNIKPARYRLNSNVDNMNISKKKEQILISHIGSAFPFAFNQLITLTNTISAVLPDDPCRSFPSGNILLHFAFIKKKIILTKAA